MKDFEIEGIKCVVSPYLNARKVIYMIYPGIEPFKTQWIEEQSAKFQVNIVMVYIPADGWNDMLTPWPAPGETPDSPPFGGQAAKTLKLLQDKIIPQAEEILGITSELERDLIGVSLSGLFTFWQWMQSTAFKSIACLSASFWYEGFMDWFEKTAIPQKDGKAFFLLGVKEPKAWIKAYRSVGVNTQTVVNRLKGSGIPVTFEWVPGDHFAEPEGRAEKALQALAD